MPQLLLLLLLLRGKRGKRGKARVSSRELHALELACVDRVQHGQARGHAEVGRQVMGLRGDTSGDTSGESVSQEQQRGVRGR